MSNLAEHAVALSARPRPVKQRRVVNAVVRCSDTRWPAIAAALAELRASNRRSIRIVDADCDDGTLLLCAVRLASALGFTAIEARGIEDVPALVGCAQSAAAALHDPAIGITFETADLVRALEQESEFPADIVISHSCSHCGRLGGRPVGDLLAAAGHTLIVDPARPMEIAA